MSKRRQNSKIPVRLAARAAGCRKSRTIPAILLEGDSSPNGGGPERRHELGATECPPPSKPLDQPRELPEAYGTKTLLLTARDPHWLYAHWDLTREQLQHYNELSTDHHLILRVYLDRIAGEPLRNVHVHPESKNWFVHVDLGGRNIAELGYHKADSGPFATQSRPRNLSKDTSAISRPFPLRCRLTTDAGNPRRGKVSASDNNIDHWGPCSNLSGLSRSTAHGRQPSGGAPLYRKNGDVRRCHRITGAELMHRQVVRTRFERRPFP
jgi:hypothetical protein